MKLRQRTFLGVLFLLGLLVLTSCGLGGLRGNYKTESSILTNNTEVVLRFKGKSVSTIGKNGKVVEKGSYEISDDELKIKMGDDNLKAQLSDDKKSFRVKSIDNTNIPFGVLKFKKVED